jgi:hypothetical protein
MEKAAQPQPYRPGRAVLQGILDLRPSLGLEVAAFPVDDAVAQGLAVAKVYAFASIDYPGAAQSSVLDSDGTTAVGAFDFDPSNDTGTTAFTFAGGVYQRDSMAFCSRLACLPRSTFRSRPATPGRSLAITATPRVGATASSTPAVPSAQWTLPALARPS